MAEYFSAKDEARLHGAKGNLAEAQSIIEEALRHGKCPLSEALAKEARVLSEAATALLNRLGVR